MAASGARSRRVLLLGGAALAAVVVAILVFLVLRVIGGAGAVEPLDRVHTIAVLDPTAELRCERLGYPCSWAEADGDIFERTLELMEIAAEMIGEDRRLADQLSAAEEFLASHTEVAEVAFDADNLTMLMFRLNGGVPVFIETPAAGPIGVESQDDAGDVSLDALDAEVGAVPASYKPTQEPGLRQRDAVVFDPYVAVEKFPEGQRVRDAIAAHPHYAGNVRYVRNPGISDLYGWGEYDAVHVATHGGSFCERRYTFVGRVLGDPEVDQDRCISSFAWGTVNPRTFDRESVPRGVTLSTRSGRRPRLHVTSEFYVAERGALGGMGDTIVYLSACGTAGNEPFRAPAKFSGAFGALLGWDASVWANDSEEAAVEFWRLMAQEGLELDLAMHRLEQEGLRLSSASPDNRTEVLYEELGISPQARLQSFGENRRARDVVAAFVRGDEIVDGATIPTEGLVGDGANDVIKELTFLVEGVRTGTEGAVEIEVRIDGESLEPISLQDRTLVDQGDGWADWEVAVEELELPFDLKKGDVDPVIPTAYRWEARVFRDAARYSAQIARPVYFSGTLRAEGRLPIYDQLDAELAGTGARITENLLYIEFPSDGGEVSGGFIAVLEHPLAEGRWTMELTGVYDAATGRIQGQATGESFGSAAGLSVRDFGTGSYDATVDFSAGVVTGTFYVGDQSQPINARF